MNDCCRLAVQKTIAKIETIIDKICKCEKCQYKNKCIYDENSSCPALVFKERIKSEISKLNNEVRE